MHQQIMVKGKYYDENMYSVHIEMLEGLDIKEPMHGSMLKVTRPETSGVMPKNNFGNIKAAVCPICGYVELYLSRLDKIQQYNR